MEEPRSATAATGWQASPQLPKMDAEGRVLHAGWQPIETAPRDGSVFLAYQPADPSNPAVWPELMGVGYFYSHGFRLDGVGGYEVEYDLERPTHWMPLPTPPSDRG